MFHHPSKPYQPTLLLTAWVLALSLAAARAQNTPAPAADSARTATPLAVAATGKAIKLEAVTVTGSNLRRLEWERVLPVTVFTSDMMAARNALTPVELLTALPQVTTVPLNESSSGGANSRGDNANLNLRGIGPGSTLVLLNGRRLAPQPLTSPDAGQLAFFVNVNQLPMHGLERIDLLRDGASSVYGSDAIAGVINVITRRDFRGTELRTQIRLPEHGGGRSYQGTWLHGFDFAGGKGRWLTTLDYLHREPIFYRERPRTRTPDQSAQAPPPFNVPGSAFDDRSAIGIHPTFRVGEGTETHWFRPVNGTPVLTDTAPSRTENPEYYFNFTRYQNYGQSQTSRINGFSQLEVELNERMTAFADLSFYHANSRLLRQPINLNAPTSDQPAPLSIDNPFNPYGSRYYSATGAPNPDGTPRLTGTPQSITLLGLSLVENGPEDVEVNSGVYRGVAGLRGTAFDEWTWETAALYTRAYSSDVSRHAVRESLFQQALQRGDETAFNPFGYTFRVAGDAVVADQPHANSRSVLDSFVRVWRRDGFSAITSVDFRTAGPLFRFWDNTVSLAAGGEFRREQFSDRRPPFAGINPPESGLDPNDNDYLLASPKPDSSGERDIRATYLETVVPVFAPGRNTPGLYLLELSASVRHEAYSDFGRTTRPKFGLSWRPFPSLMIRASYNRGFAAPNLPTLYAPSQYTVDTLPGRIDPYLAQTLGTAQYVMRNYSSGNPQLQPVTSTGRTAGIVVEVPAIKGLSFSADYWEIDQQDVVGSRFDSQILDSDNALLRSYTAAEIASGRAIHEIDLGSGTASYKGDPAILRNPPTPEDVAAFEAYNATRPPSEQAAVVGRIFSRSSPYENIARGFVSGVDLSLAWQLPTTPIGRVSFNTDWSYLIKNQLTRHPAGDAPSTSERLGVDGTTRWRGAGTIAWRQGNWQANVGAYYIGDYADSGGGTTAEVFEDLGQPGYISKQFTSGNFVYRYRVRDVISCNAAISYRFGPEAPRLIRNTSIRLGSVNLTDQEPPLTPDTAGYAPAIHATLFPGRTWTLELTRQF